MMKEINPTRLQQEQELPAPGEPVETETSPNLGRRWERIFLFSILGLLLVGGLVFAGCQVAQKQAVLVPTPPPADIIPSPKPTPTPTSLTSPSRVSTEEEDPIANWKTFSNGNYLYSIKYPHDWPTIQSVEPGQKSTAVGLHGAQLLGQVVYLSKYLPEVKPPYLQIESLQNQSLTDFENKQASGCSEPTFTVTETTLNSAPVIIGHRVSPDEPGQPYSTGHQYCALIFHKGTIYILDWGEGSFEDSGLFNQFLSTFKFLD